MSIDYSKLKTADQLLAERARSTLDAALIERRCAYQFESDPLRFEADYDALIQGLKPDYTAWFASVAAIKERFPLPVVEPSGD